MFLSIEHDLIFLLARTIWIRCYYKTSLQMRKQSWKRWSSLFRAAQHCPVEQESESSWLKACALNLCSSASPDDYFSLSLSFFLLLPAYHHLHFGYENSLLYGIIPTYLVGCLISLVTSPKCYCLPSVIVISQCSHTFQKFLTAGELQDWGFWNWRGPKYPAHVIWSKKIAATLSYK